MPLAHELISDPPALLRERPRVRATRTGRFSIARGLGSKGGGDGAAAGGGSGSGRGSSSSNGKGAAKPKPGGLIRPGGVPAQ